MTDIRKLINDDEIYNRLRIFQENLVIEIPDSSLSLRLYTV